MIAISIFQVVSLSQPGIEPSTLPALIQKLPELNTLVPYFGIRHNTAHAQRTAGTEYFYK